MSTHATNFKPTRLTAAERLAQRRRPVGYREPVTRTNASNSSQLALSKGPTRADEKTAKQARQAAVIKAVRAAVFARSAYCETCGDSERETASKWHSGVHHMHELQLRSATRCRQPEERFSTAMCCRACGPCHAAFHAKTLRPLPLTEAGMDAVYDVQRWDDEITNWITVLTVDRARGLRA